MFINSFASTRVVNDRSKKKENKEKNNEKPKIF